MSTIHEPDDRNARRLTYEEFMRLPDVSVQLIGGEVVREPSPTARHQFVQSRLGLLLVRHVLERELGVVLYAPLDVRLGETEVFQPDILFIANERRCIIAERIDGAPDLVVEILSPSTAHFDLQRKRLVYESSGVREYWIVDPIELTIEVLTSIDGAFARTASARASGSVASSILDGFDVDVAWVLAER